MRVLRTPRFARRAMRVLSEAACRYTGWSRATVGRLRAFPWSRYTIRPVQGFAARGTATCHGQRDRLRQRRELDRTRTRQQRLAARSRRWEAAAAGAAVLACVLVTALAPPAADPSAAAATGGSATGLVQAGSEGLDGDGAAVAMTRSTPTRIRIPAVGVDVEVFGADLDPNGGPPTPSEADAMRAAWYAGGVAPGEPGGALLVGHLDTYSGPAAFAGLGMLQTGSTIEIDREDGTTALFTVDSVEQYPKYDFPDERVYGTVDTPQLRLITCGGQWTPGGGYDSNIVAYASLAQSYEVTAHQPG